MGQTPELYHPIILEHSKNPCHFHEVTSAQHVVNAINHYCGDKFQVGFELDEVIASPAFHGYGCAVSKAATSLLTEAMDRQTLEELSKRCQLFLAFLQGDAPCPAFDERLAAFEAVRAHPGRMQCATLSWQAVLEACDRLLNKSHESM